MITIKKGEQWSQHFEYFRAALSYYLNKNFLKTPSYFQNFKKIFRAVLKGAFKRTQTVALLFYLGGAVVEERPNI